MNFGNMSANDIIFSLKRYIWILLLSTVVGGFLMMLVSVTAIPKKYESYLDIYVTSKSRTEGQQDIDYDEITASQKLVNTYMVILQTQDSYDKVNKISNLNYSINHLKEVLTFTNVNGTEILRVTATTENPNDAYLLCDAYSLVASDVLADVIEGGSVKIVSAPRVNENPVSPNVMFNSVLGAFIGLLIALVYAVFNMSTTSILSTVRSEDQINNVTPQIVLGSVPSVWQNKRNNYLMPNKEKKAIPNKIFLSEKSPNFVHDAYKKLKTNIIFAAKAKQKKIIVVTGCSSDEYSALTALNLAESYANEEKKVLLIDADFRSGTLHKMLRVENNCGLSSFIVDTVCFDECIQDCNKNFDVITSGPFYTDPSEILESDKVKILCNKAASLYDVVIISSSPIGGFLDSVAFANEKVGYVLVVRKNHTLENQLKSAINNLENFGCSALGIAMTVDVKNGVNI